MTSTAHTQAAESEALDALARLREHAPPQRQLRPHVETLVGVAASTRALIEAGVDTWLASFPADARAAAAHLIDGGGKRLRPMLTLLATRAAGGTDEQALPVAIAVELLHNGTLLHDDVIDEAPLRRGRPAAHAAFGNALAIIAGDFCYFAALDSLVLLGDLDILRRAMDVARRLATGELIQLERRGRAHRIDEAEYFRIIEHKTAALFAFATWAGARASKGEPYTCEALHAYGYDLGLAFQIVDDVLDFEGEVEQVGKSVGHDLAEGVITLPLAYAMEEDDELARDVACYIERLRQGDQLGAQATSAGPGSGLTEVMALTERTRRTGALARARARAVSLSERAQSHLSALAPSPPRDSLDAIARLLQDRLA